MTEIANSGVAKLYITPKQKDFLRSTAPVTVVVASRGWGKTRTSGLRMVKCAQSMPRSKGMLVGISYQQLETKEIPEILNTLRQIGFVEYRRGAKITTPFMFVYGKQPPACFHEPATPPEDYKRTLSFSNGSCIELIAMTGRDGARGGSYDYAFVAEAAYINGTNYTTQIAPMVRGLANKYDSPHYLSTTMTTSMPWTAQGAWVFAMKDLQETGGVTYIDGDIYDCIQIYGAETIAQWRRNICAINPIIWEVEYLNKRLDRPTNAYYPDLNAERHFYSATPLSDPYYAPHDPLYLTFDFNSALYTLLVAQYTGVILSIQKEFFDFGNLEAAVNSFCDLYCAHANKNVYIYGDVSGHYGKADNQINLTGYELVKKTLRARGWNPITKVKYESNPAHFLRYEYINKALKEEHALNAVLIRINQLAAKYTTISLLSAPIKPDFTKDKRSETNTQIDQRDATHASDAFDYLVYPIVTEMIRQTSAKYIPG